MVALVASMTVGALVLMALDDRPLSAGAFSLASYSRLNSIDQIVESRAVAKASRWDRIEIYYSRTKGGNLEQIAALNGHTSSEDVNFHFLICNGLGGSDGFVSASEKWQRQWSCLPGRNWYGSGQTIRICIVGDGVATDSQIKRLGTLAESLCRRFNISKGDVIYPGNWEL